MVAVVPRRARASSVELMASVVRCGCEWGRQRRVNEGRARAEGSRARSSSSQPARGVVRASRARGGHAAAAI